MSAGDRQSSSRLECPGAGDEIVDEGRRGVRPVGRGPAGQDEADQVTGLEDECHAVQQGRPLPPEPEELGGDVERRRQVPGPAMDLCHAEPIADPGRFRRGPVVAIDQARPERAVRCVEDDDRRALRR